MSEMPDDVYVTMGNIKAWEKEFSEIGGKIAALEARARLIQTAIDGLQAIALLTPQPEKDGEKPE